MGEYIVDFCCLDQKLIIELDGGHHYTSEQQARDAVRQKFLESLGYTVLRFSNNEVDVNLEGVVSRILQYLQPHPNPLP